MKKLIAYLAFAVAAWAADTPDLTMQTRIRQEGLRNSKVMEIATGLVDGIGGRLTGSPNMKRANEWTRDKLTEFGLANAHLESWGPFGRGWSYESCSVRMTAPDLVQLVAIPKAWSRGTNGVLRGRPVKVKLATTEDLQKEKGKLAGRIVMTSEAAMTPRQHDVADFKRYDTKELAEIEQYDIAPNPRFTPEEAARRRRFRRELARFLEDEKVAAVIEEGRGDFGTMVVQSSGSQKADEPQGVPTVTMESEHYDRMARLLDAGKDVELELDVKTTFYDQDQNAYNTVAEIPGADKKNEVVMLGAHLDSWHSGTGATDNGAGVVATMEAVPVLKAIGIAPRRTIRIALWSGEEQGLLGSRAYAGQHFGKRAEPKDPKQRELPGTGRVRGIYAQGNAAVRPLFESWIGPLKDLGVTTVTLRNTGGTDHVSFDEVGLPGFQFIQDEIEYETRTHHTNYDSYERLQKEDLMQAATVIATFVWEAANRPEMMPRKPLAQSDIAPSASAATPH